MALQGYTDNYSSTLSAGYTSGGTSLSVASASGLPASGLEFYLLVAAEGSNTAELFKVTSYTGTTLTVVGAQGGTSASNHASGATITGCYVVAASLDGIRADLSQYGTDASLPSTTGQKAGNLYHASDSGKIYRFNGSSWDNPVKYPAGLILLEEHTASSSADLQFLTRNAAGQSGNTFNSDFDEYVLEVINMAVATNGAAIGLQVHTGGAFVVTANYAWAFQYIGTAGDNGFHASSSDTMVNLVGNVINNAGFNSSATARIFDPQNSSCWKQFLYDAMSTNTDTAHHYRDCGSGLYTQNTAIDGFRLICSSGNIASGTARLYGLAK